jgi:hypothetical protein
MNITSALALPTIQAAVVSFIALFQTWQVLYKATDTTDDAADDVADDAAATAAAFSTLAAASVRRRLRLSKR